jgi:predicted DNA-binding transcriptional regulator AlpA
MKDTTSPTGHNKGKAQQRRVRLPRRISPADLPDDALVDIQFCCDFTNLGKSYIAELTSKKKFPPVIRLGLRCSRRKMGELRRWAADPIRYRAP